MRFQAIYSLGPVSEARGYWAGQSSREVPRHEADIPCVSWSVETPRILDHTADLVRAVRPNQSQGFVARESPCQHVTRRKATRSRFAAPAEQRRRLEGSRRARVRSEAVAEPVRRLKAEVVEAQAVRCLEPVRRLEAEVVEAQSVQCLERVVGAEDYGQYVHAFCPDLMRPCEVPYLRGDPSKAIAKLGWRPQITFAALVRRMVESAGPR
jgi:GDP-mannose 4,6 dehydratase